MPGLAPRSGAPRAAGGHGNALPRREPSGPAPLDVPVAILAGGLGTRLLPLTERIPKALIEVAGRPFLEHQLLLLRENGIGAAVLCVGHFGAIIRERIGGGRRFGLEVAYSEDGPAPLGTAGAIRRALPLLGPRFFVLYGDSYLRCPFRPVFEAFEKSGKLGLMTVYRNCGRYDTSNVEFEGGRILRYDKIARTERMRHIDYGLGVFAASAFDGVPDGHASDLAGVYQRLLARGELAPFEVRERFYEIGSAAGLEETEAYLRGGRTCAIRPGT